MNINEINSRIEKISKNLNTDRSQNRIVTLDNKIRSDLNNNGVTNQEAVKNRKQKSVTNHQRGKSDIPIDDYTDGKSISISNQYIKELSQHLSHIIDELDDVSDDVANLDPDDLSPSIRTLQNQIFSVKDDLKVTLFNQRGNRYYFERDARDINKSSGTDEEKIDNLDESLDQIVEECSKASERLRSIEVPSEDEVLDEVEETRRKRMKREMEEMRPYESIGQIKRKFNSGEVFTAQDLADKVDFWSKSTAKSTIQEAMEIEGQGDMAEITEVSEGQYKIVY